MRNSRLRSKLQQDLPVLVTTLHFTDPSLFELTSLMGFDGIWIDLEHHGVSLETASQLMRAARVGSADIVARPAKGEFLRLGRLLEAGAQAIMYPQCDHVDEARDVVRWSKFPPHGRRGIDGANPDAPYLALPIDAYVQRANQQTMVIIQIENPAALECVEQIAEVDGVDILMLGPGDLSVSLGIPGETNHPHIEQAWQRIGAAATRAGKHFGGPVGTPAEASRRVAMGARFICYQADFLLVKAGLEQIQRDMRPLGFEFDNRLGHE